MSAVITPFEGTELFNTASFNNRISQINTGFSYVSNPNLLDNWYFVRPVNQRGQMEYTGNGYSVDRWGILNNVTATLQNASLNIAYTESEWNLYTFLDNVLMPGTTYTLSCLYKASGNPIRLICTWGINKFFYNEQAPISDDWTLAEITGTIPADATIDENEIVVQSLGSGAGNFSLKAIKLELGPTQTLAHQENGVWVLNEVPNYGEQLRRCWRYYINSSTFGVGEAAAQRCPIWPIKSTSIHYCSGAQFPVVMRTTPVVTIYSAVNGTKNAVSNALNGTDSPATASAAFVGSDGFHQITLQGDDAALDQSVACFTYVASAEL